MKENLSVSLKYTTKFISDEEIAALAQKSVIHLDSLNSGTGPGNDFTGWLTLPDDIVPQLERIQKTADHLRSVSDTTVVIGIGGSYLGARAVTEALSHSFTYLQKEKHHDIFYAGHNIDEDYMAELLEILDNRNYSLLVISKSGTTTEPAIAFRILKNHLEKKLGKEAAASRIIAITDASKGALKKMAGINNYETFVIPDNIGGRYSVLTPVGLLPIAVSGLNIRELVQGAKAMMELTRNNHHASSNPVLIYAATRNLILQTGRPLEILASFSSKLHYLAEWWKQLYGESEGKEGKGIFPASVDFTTDLHSLGQYIQEGRRMLFETMISVNRPQKNISIPHEKDDSDQLNYIAGGRLSMVNNNAQTGTILAHNDGEVPIILITIPEISAYYIGQLLYFFELACAVSGYILDINPFDQPGVEAYKKNMFALLNKPGYEDTARKMREKLK